MNAYLPLVSKIICHYLPNFPSGNETCNCTPGDWEGQIPKSWHMKTAYSNTPILRPRKAETNQIEANPKKKIVGTVYGLLLGELNPSVQSFSASNRHVLDIFA